MLLRASAALPVAIAFKAAPKWAVPAATKDGPRLAAPAGWVFSHIRDSRLLVGSSRSLDRKKRRDLESRVTSFEPRHHFTGVPSVREGIERTEPDDLIVDHDRLLVHRHPRVDNAADLLERFDSFLAESLVDAAVFPGRAHDAANGDALLRLSPQQISIASNTLGRDERRPDGNAAFRGRQVEAQNLIEVCFVEQTRPFGLNGQRERDAVLPKVSRQRNQAHNIAHVDHAPGLLNLMEPVSKERAFRQLAVQPREVTDENQMILGAAYRDVEELGTVLSGIVRLEPEAWKF